MTDVVELLQQLNFSEYEARAYIALLQHNPLNGYALAKESGIPRACLLYTSDAADDLLCVDLGCRRIIKKKTTTLITHQT